MPEASITQMLFDDSQGAVLFKDSGDSTNGYIVFTVEDPDNPTGEAWKVKVLFQHLPMNLTDSRKANYQVVPILKRTEPFLVYQSTGFREISFGLTFHAETPQDAYDIFAVSSLFRRSLLPTRKGFPNMVKLYLGPWYINYAMKISGNGIYTMVKDNYTEDEDGFNAIIESADLQPSENRFVAKEVTGVATTPQGWYEKFPSSITVGLGLKVFLSDVWAMKYIKSFENMYNTVIEGFSPSTTTNSTPPSQDNPMPNPTGRGIVETAEDAWAEATQNVTDLLFGSNRVVPGPKTRK